MNIIKEIMESRINMNIIRKYLSFIIGFVLFWIIGLISMKAVYYYNYDRSLFIEKLSAECNSHIKKYSNRNAYTYAVDYYNRLNLKVDETTYIHLVNNCVN